MSRTTRLKNNFRETTQDAWKPRDVKPVHDYKWVDRGDGYQHLTHVDYECKRQYFRDYRWYHEDGKAYASYGKPAPFVYGYFNRKDRHANRMALSEHVKTAAANDDFYAPVKKLVTLNYF